MHLTTTTTIILVFLVTTTTSRSVLQNNDCSFHSANYSINWIYDELSNDVVFKLTARSTFSNFYSAVAFGNEKPEDVIAVYVRSLQIGLIDGHLVDDGAIESDEKTNVQALQFDLQNGVLMAQFARPVETFDSQDADLGNCITMFFPTESREIITGAPLELGNLENLQKIRICDIAVTCADKKHNDILVKRQEDEPICSFGAENSKNQVDWEVDGELIHFSVTQNSKKGRWWTAIGVGESMNDLNMILLFAENGKLKQQGIYRTEGKMMPVNVEYDGIELRKDSAIVENGKANFNVSIEKKFFLERANEQGCFIMQIAILGGQYQPNFNIQKHVNTPQELQICDLEACKAPVGPQQQIDGETRKPELENNLEEASGVVPTPEVPVNDVEGSGLPVEPKKDFEEATVTPKIGEIIEEKTLTSDEKPVDLTSSTPIPEPMTPPTNHVFAVDNQTTSSKKTSMTSPDKINDAPESATTTPTSSENSNSQKKNGCGVDHEDLKICESYFSEYLGKVNEWSERHNMTVASHMWKACTLLSQVQHVTTMCCTIFRNTCATHLNL